MGQIDQAKTSKNCDENNIFGSYKAIEEKDIKPILTIEELLQKNDFEKHISLFELPSSIKEIMTIDEVNAAISWYFKWKLITPISEQNTCTIKKIFGLHDGLKIIIAVNFYKYLRNKEYDPEIVEMFLIENINNKNIKEKNR